MARTSNDLVHFQDLSSIEIRTVLDPVEMDALGRGEMTVRVHPTEHPDRVLTGRLVPRFSCDILDCVLVGRGAATDPVLRGLAFLYFNRHGSLVYTIRSGGRGEDGSTLSQDQNKSYCNYFTSFLI